MYVDRRRLSERARLLTVRCGPSARLPMSLYEADLDPRTQMKSCNQRNDGS